MLSIMRRAAEWCHTMLTDCLGYLAASLVFGTFCSQRAVTLRSFAIASNLAFIGYGYLASLWPILILHGAMLPINIVRCRQSMRGALSVVDMRRTPGISPSQPSLGSIVGSVLGRLRCWQQRKQLRRDVFSMSVCDFRDQRVPTSLVADALLRRPRQEPSPQWRTVGSRWSRANRDELGDHPTAGIGAEEVP